MSLDIPFDRMTGASAGGLWTVRVSDGQRFGIGTDVTLTRATVAAMHDLAKKILSPEGLALFEKTMEEA